MIHIGVGHLWWWYRGCLGQTYQRVLFVAMNGCQDDVLLKYNLQLYCCDISSANELMDSLIVSILDNEHQMPLGIA